MIISYKTKTLIYYRFVISSLLILLVFIKLLGGCSLRKVDRELISPEELSSLQNANSLDGTKAELDSLYLKAHMQDGSVYAFNSWTVDSTSNSVTGNGKLFDSYRTLVGEGTFTISIDSVAIFETNKLHPSSAIAPMSIITGISLVATIYCISNPKACFGSCPTIYTQEENIEVLQAEAFSASISPSLEDTDIDKLPKIMTNNKRFQLTVKNEALETHIIRSMDLLAVPSNANTQTYLGIDGEFYKTNSPIQPISCVDGIGNCLKEIKSFDGIERFSRTDSTDLANREIIEIEFEGQHCKQMGLVIGCRQTLLSTYLLYSGFEFLGSNVGNWMAEIERGSLSTKNSAGGMGRILGGIDVRVIDKNGNVTFLGSVNETGPLARDMHLIPLPHGLEMSKKIVQLELAKGHWRIDNIALVCIEENCEPITLNPTKVYYESLLDILAREKLLDSASMLVTFPGDEYVIEYELPDSAISYDLFVRSRGYYIEWIRKEWVAGEDLTRASEIFFAPSQALRRFAPEFKQVEADMEDVFWNSKYVK